MAKNKSTPKKDKDADKLLPNVGDYRHKSAKRKNNPPAKIAAEGVVPVIPKAVYHYSPRRPPALRFDVDGQPDQLPELLAEAQRRPLTADEAQQLAEALRTQEPWLEWAGKLEQQQRGFFTVDPVALHIHERISTQAILKVAARLDVEKSLFADPELEYKEAVRFYTHDIDWTNRLILGDSVHVMSSLARREDLAGKVQMIYLDPPYGIKYPSNFQPEIGKRDVKDKETDLTREPEMVKAYRDTWTLGVHSYLSYLRDRLIVARDLLADTGSMFVQIGDENVHRVRGLLDEVFGGANLVSQICVAKTSSVGAALLSGVVDYILWYARDKEKLKYRPLFRGKEFGISGTEFYTAIELPTGEFKPLNVSERRDSQVLAGGRIYRLDNLSSQSRSDSTVFEYEWDGKRLGPGTGGWKTNLAGMNRLAQAGRIRTRQIGNTICYIRYVQDFPAIPISNLWTDLTSGFNIYQPKLYVVQTNERIIERCLLMTTDPGDLVIDPTSGAGTTAEVAEQWGRRWITIDTSRVALAIARQRLLTAKFDYFKLRDDGKGIAAGFLYKSVPHITLKSIAQNNNLDPIFAKHEPILDKCLAACNSALAGVNAEVRRKLELKLLDKQRAEGKRAATDADRRRWELPAKGVKWDHWQVPFDTDPDWPKKLADAVTVYRKAWRAKMDEVDGCIAANAEQEELVDQPEIERGVVRVSGPFTVEAVQPPEMTLGEDLNHRGTEDTEKDKGKGEREFGGAPDELAGTFEVREVFLGETPENVAAYLEQMIRLLRTDGIRFPDNKAMTFTRLEPIYAAGQANGFHAEGRWTPKGEADDDPDGPATVGVVIGPQYGPVTAKMVEELIRPASRRYDDLVIAGFSFTAEAQAVIDEKPHPKLRIHIAHIRPDVNPGMNGLLKEQPGSQLFTVFGRPRTRLEGPEDGEYTIIMEGVDIYNPVDNSITPTRADKVAAWFLDGDYDGKTFCITQAFFPDSSAWDKLSKALSGVVDAERFQALSGTTSLPFRAGKQKCAAVKVIDPRGNEVMSVHTL